MNTTTVASKSGADLEAVYQALDRVQAIIEFDLDGTVLSANDNFLKLFGYEWDEDGKPVKVVKYATDVSEDKLKGH